MSNRKTKLRKEQQDTVIICPPEKAGRGPAVRIFGTACRVLVAFFAVLGLSLLFTDAIKLPLELGFIIASAAIGVAFCTLFFISKIGPYIGAGVGLVYIAVKFILDNDFFKYLILGCQTLYNTVLKFLAERNFVKMADFIVDVEANKYSDSALIECGVVIFILVLCSAFVPFIIKKTIVAVPVMVSSLLLGVVFTYNMSRNNWAFVLIIASFSAIIVLSVYDRYYIKNAKKNEDNGEAMLFGESDRPKPIAEDLTNEHKEQRIAGTKREKTLDDELSSYFSTGKKAEKPKKPKHSEQLRRQLERIKKYDRMNKSAKSAMGGFVAFGTFVIMFILLLLPGFLINDSFEHIEAISVQMDYYREYITAFLQGDEMVLDDLAYARTNSNFAPRSTDATDRRYNGTQFFYIETATANDIYMPGWIATEYRNGSWYTSSYRDDANITYRSLYSSKYDRESTPSESLYYDFMSTFLPYEMRQIDFEDAKLSINSSYGFVGEQINIRRLATIGTQCYFPSKFNRLYELRKFGEGNKSELSYVNFFDGIYTGEDFGKLSAEYAVVSYLTLQTNKNWNKNISGFIAEFNEIYNIVSNNILKPRKEKISFYRDKNDTLALIYSELYNNINCFKNENQVGVQIPNHYLYFGSYNVTLPENPDESTFIMCYDINLQFEITPDGELIKNRINNSSKTEYEDLPLAIRYKLFMSDAERMRLVSLLYDYYIYRNFVYETYTGTADSEIISEYYENFLNSMTQEEYYALTKDKDGYSAAPNSKNSTSKEAYENRHELVMKIISSFADEKNGFTYTLTPRKEKNAELDGVENFLTVTKEGYCVQFASALTLLLREAGIPARYVEGFIASDFLRTQSRKSKWEWSSIVKDENAHAWVEVWYDGLGWVQYEATPNFYSSAYNIDTNGNPIVTTAPETTAVDPPDTTTVLPPESSEVTTDPSDTTLDPLTTTNSGDEYPIISPETVKKILIAFAILISSGLLLSVVSIWLTKRSEHHKNEKMRLLNMAEKKTIPENERHSVAKRLIDMTTELLGIYGMPHGKFDQRSEYAKKLEGEYLDIFGTAVRNPKAKFGNNEPEFIKVSDTDFAALFDAMAAEEFGIDGMTEDDIASLAVFYKRLYESMPKRLSKAKAFKYKYFKLI